MDPHTATDPVRLIGYTFAVSSLAGLAALLRSGQEITPRQLAAATLSAGLLGSGIMLVWWDWMGGRFPWFMMGVSLLAGLGGVNMLEFAIQLIQQAARAYVMRAADTLPLSEHYRTDVQHDVAQRAAAAAVPAPHARPAADHPYADSTDPAETTVTPQ